MPAAEVQTITRAACMEVAQECSPSGLPQEPGACEPGLGYTTIAKVRAGLLACRDKLRSFVRRFVTYAWLN